MLARIKNTAFIESSGRFWIFMTNVKDEEFQNILENRCNFFESPCYPELQIGQTLGITGEQSVFSYPTVHGKISKIEPLENNNCKVYLSDIKTWVETMWD